MEIKIKLIVLILGVVLTGLTAGLCFTWSNAVTPGIARLDDLNFLRSFQAMNKTIINGTFLMVFFGPVILLCLNTYLFKSTEVSFWLYLAAAILFFFGLALVTIFGNVPLNEILDKSNLETMSKTDLKVLRDRFEAPWNQWHMVRTITSILSFTCLVIGVIINK